MRVVTFTWFDKSKEVNSQTICYCYFGQGLSIKGFRQPEMEGRSGNISQVDIHVLIIRKLNGQVEGLSWFNIWSCIHVNLKLSYSSWSNHNHFLWELVIRTRIVHLLTFDCEVISSAFSLTFNDISKNMFSSVSHIWRIFTWPCCEMSF